MVFDAEKCHGKSSCLTPTLMAQRELVGEMKLMIFAEEWYCVVLKAQGTVWWPSF